MKALILAAGLGTRLRPLTDSIPKALVPVNGIPILERVIVNLKNNGFEEIIINVHHLAHLVKDFLRAKDFGVRIKISDESEELLDTGGGLVKAYDLLFAEDSSPVLVHNVDIIGNAKIPMLMRQYEINGIGATLLVNDRKSTRKLVFDNEMNLKGWHNIEKSIYKPINFSAGLSDLELAFSGIYIISKESIIEMKELCGIGKYSVMDYFLNENRRERIKGFWQKDLNLIDIGKPASLSQASQYIKD